MVCKSGVAVRTPVGRTAKRSARRSATALHIRLLREPFVPFFCEFIYVLGGYGDEHADVADLGGVFFEVDLVEEVFDGAMTPFVDLLG